MEVLRYIPEFPMRTIDYFCQISLSNAILAMGLCDGTLFLSTTFLPVDQGAKILVAPPPPR